MEIFREGEGGDSSYSIIFFLFFCGVYVYVCRTKENIILSATGRAGGEPPGSKLGCAGYGIDHVPGMAHRTCSMDHRTCSVDHRCCMVHRTCFMEHRTCSIDIEHVAPTWSMVHRTCSTAKEHVLWLCSIITR